MKKNPLSKYALVMIAACASAQSQAALLSFYADGVDVDAAALVNQAAPVVNSTVSDLSLFGLEGVGTATSITRPSFNIDTPAGPTAGSAAGSEWIFGRNGDANQAAAVFDDAYVGFTIAADAGFTLSLTDIVYDYYATSNEDSFNINGQAEAFISVDGGTFNSFGSVSSMDGDLALLTNGPVATANFDLSSITGASNVEIRVAFGLAGSDTVGNQFAYTGFVQGIQVNGDIVPVPEPSSALLAFMSLGLLARRRR